MNTIQVNYDKMSLDLIFEGIKHNFNLKDGDAGEFWHGFQHKEKEFDLNFHINDDNETYASIYSTKEDDEGFIVMDDEEATIDSKNIKETGNKDKYLSYWWYEDLKNEICRENQIQQP